MKILFLDSPSYGKEDIICTFKKLNFEVVPFYHENLYEYNDTVFNQYFDDFVANQSFDFAFSFNYFPAISMGCTRNQLKYLSFVYDSPQVALFSYTIINPCNYVFLFDKTLYLRLKNEGIPTVYYLPLCVNADRLSKLSPITNTQTERFTSDVSFVGSLYTEEHNLFDRMNSLSDYTTGYLNAIMQAQAKINGYFFLESLLTPEILADMKHSVPYVTRPDGTESDAYIYANYFLARKLTSLERIDLLKLVSQRFDTSLYTINPTPFLPNCKNMGTVDYLHEMPYVFRTSRINLNITLRSIYSGIPLRAYDIMGAGGFLLTNYQEDFFDFFAAGEDFAYYDGNEDLLEKVEYYLSHEQERAEIAKNACRKVRTEHTWKKRIQTMLDIAF